MSDNDVGIRPFEALDWLELCRIYEAAAPAELSMAGIDPMLIRPMCEDEPKERFLDINTSLVAYSEGQVLGFVAWREGGFISWLYVEPAHQQRGIGTRLLDEAMRRIGSNAWTLAKDGNTPAIALYQKRGMDIVKSYPAEYWGCPFKELRLALPTSPKHDANVPNFGV